ncbi:hypothetical protein PRUPE_1G141900 [Prunus persica]|uniref:Uncharacterized protein n=1 Tax=Prunus persica TaxID=3760 RepID=A0A251QX70_PRUPE|nr:hypothetical protein PRUPE_1G141900 [Prunus persica]
MKPTMIISSTSMQEKGEKLLRGQDSTAAIHGNNPATPRWWRENCHNEKSYDNHHQNCCETKTTIIIFRAAILSHMQYIYICHLYKPQA